MRLAGAWPSLGWLADVVVRVVAVAPDDAASLPAVRTWPSVPPS
ncbi:hypothetical protein [Kutzneria sp. CA-103260]|nr:hypothetical protein [Kutzneria sp. CA-103260]